MNGLLRLSFDLDRKGFCKVRQAYMFVVGVNIQTMLLKCKYQLGVGRWALGVGRWALGVGR